MRMLHCLCQTSSSLEGREIPFLTSVGLSLARSLSQQSKPQSRFQRQTHDILPFGEQTMAIRGRSSMALLTSGYNIVENPCLTFPVQGFLVPSATQPDDSHSKSR